MKMLEFRYLELLEESDSQRLAENLRDLLIEEPGIILTEKNEGQIRFCDDLALAFSSDCPAVKKTFFQWLAREFNRRTEAKRDELTGLITRSYWERKLSSDFSGDSEPVIAMIDIDHFKRFNDDYGHQMGDAVLAAVGDVLREKISVNALPIRYGGEEIMIVFPDANQNDAVDMIDGLRDYLAQNLVFENQPETITVSAGMAAAKPSESLADTIARSDTALYESKDTGRNRLTVYAPYLDRASSFYVWGIFRYLWGQGNRFIADNKQLILNSKEKLYRYCWKTNKTRRLKSPDDFKMSFLSARPATGGFYLIDADGKLWGLDHDFQFKLFSDSDTPAFVAARGTGREHLFLAVNNQIYFLEDNKLKRRSSMPGDWEQFCSVGGQVYYLKEQILTAENELFKNSEIQIPEPALQLTSDGRVLYLVGVSGRVFSFDVNSQQWSKLRFVNTRREQLVCREIAAIKNRLFVRDNAGRLLLCRRRSKSVPQQMDIAFI